MYTLISIFYISLIAIVAMIFLKRREVMSGQPSVLSRFGAGTDHIFQSVFSNISRFISYINKHTFIALAHLIAFHVFKHIRNIYVSIKHSFISTAYGRKMIDAVRGRGHVTDHGASFYLRRISK